MFGIGFPELILIVIIALIVFGPEKIPELAQALGKAVGEFRRATEEIKDSVSREARKLEEEIRVRTEKENIEGRLTGPPGDVPPADNEKTDSGGRTT